MMWTSLLLALTTVVAMPTPEPVQPAVIRLPLHTRDRGSRLQARSTPLTDINYQGRGADTAYHAELTVGTPPQTFSVLVDTGSGHLILPGPQCNSTACPTFNETVFHSNQSSTFNDFGKPVTIGFARGFMAGYWGQDTVLMDNTTFENQTLVVASVIRKLDSEMIGDGLLGLSWGSKNKGSQYSSLWEKLPTPQFGLWLARRANTSENGGSLTLGGFDTDVIDGEIDWIPTVPVNSGNITSGWWIPMEGISYSTNSDGTDIGDTIKTDNHVAMIDSGTTATVGPTAPLDKLYLSIPGVRKYQEHNYFRYTTNESIAQNLSISLHFNGKEYKLDKDDLFACGQIKDSCLSNFKVDSRADWQDKWVIGANFMKNVYTAFRGEPAAVGFANLKADAIADNGNSTSGNSTTSTSPSGVPDTSVSGSASRSVSNTAAPGASANGSDTGDQHEASPTPNAQTSEKSGSPNSAATSFSSSKVFSRLVTSLLLSVAVFELL